MGDGRVAPEVTRVGFPLGRHRGIRGRAQVDADALIARIQADADALIARAQREAAELIGRADADRDRARRTLLDARQRADALLNDAEEVRRAGRQALERLVGTRSDLQNAIDRLAEVASDPVLDLTGGEGVLRLAELPDDEELYPEPPPADLDPVTSAVRSAIGLAAGAASEPGRPQPWADDRPARQRAELRENGRAVL